MENGWNLFNFNNTTSPSFGRGHNSSNCTTTAVWDIWESGAAGSTSRIDWISSINPHNSFTSSASTTAVSSSTTATHEQSAAAVQALMFAHQGNHDHAHYSSFAPSRLYSGGGGGGGSHNYVADPHLMCLKLGKRHYFGEAIATPIGDRQAEAAYSITKKGKPYYDACGGTGSLGPSTSAGLTVASQAPVPRCQVDGCNVLLLNAKDYHRRHKVCEMHSKAPKVVVLGLEQRFCQQCSRSTNFFPVLP